MGSKAVLAVGLMSGTSLDGIDAALIETDGEGAIRPLAFRSEPYPVDVRRVLQDATRLALAFDRPQAAPAITAAATMLTRRHAEAVRRLAEDAGVALDAVSVVGFHGQTIAHRPDRGWTWQIGDGAAMAQTLGVTVVDDFRSADVAAGGQGAPLLPVYHRALLGGGTAPVAVLNLGGIANISYMDEAAFVAFDTGPANALLDDWVAAETGGSFDPGGSFAAQGAVEPTILDALLDNPWFDLPPPKSLDRADFGLGPVRGLSMVDGAATLTAFTARTVALALRHLPRRPDRLVVAGGGRHNATMMAMLTETCAMPVVAIEAEGRNGDAIEAEGFGYMAVRALAGLPISFPGTTGAPEPMTGGRISRP